MSIPLYIVDAFTAKPFAGNPAAVCLLPAARNEAWMQRVAREMNLSETAFLHPEPDGLRLRWFTPAVEVALCGHATLASAHVLWETGRLRTDQPARFHTQSGLLTANLLTDRIELDFPVKRAEPVAPPAGLLGALGCDAKFVGRNAFDCLVEVDSEKTLRELKPDFRALAEIPVRGVIVTSCAATPEFDFVSRFFAPASGVNEDPVTGSAHCCLAPHWQPRLNKTEFIAHQISMRGGVVRMRIEGERVKLGGHAVTVVEGRLRC